MKIILITIMAVSLCLSARADEVETYQARLSAHDHFNSNGARLTTPAAIIRQDRANFHRYGNADSEDEKDHFFANAHNREILEKLLERGHSNPAAYRAVVNGTPLVEVTIGSNYVTVRVLSE